VSSIIDSLPLICLIALAVISFILGIISLIQFARSRKPLFLILGLVLTFLLPGVCLFLSTRLLTPPDPFMVYGPPPSNHVP